MAWHMHAGSGGLGSSLMNFAGMFTWCVRGTSTMAPIVLADVNMDGTIADANAGLTWEAGHSPTELQHGAALAYCAGLVLGGPGTWRMPTITELMRLGRYDLANPAVDTLLFTTTSNFTYWAAPAFVNNAWYWNESLGTNSTTTTNTAISVRCVR
jgi:hypothetical protein